MNILMMTNNYAPLLNGVAISIHTLTEHLEKKGHKVLVVTPEMHGYERPKNVISVPAIKNAVTRIYSIPLPMILGNIAPKIDAFKPDIIHSHHPFLLGGAALRLAAKYNVPIVYTRHTRYEHYLYVKSETIKHLTMKIVDSYSGLCDAIIVPTDSMKKAMEKHSNVNADIRVIPSGVDVSFFGSGKGSVFRSYHNIPEDAFLVGTIGRLEPEKNLDFLMKALIAFLKKNPEAHSVIIGEGSLEEKIKTDVKRAKLQDRFHVFGSLRGSILAHAYAALDVFAFASKSETQGMVLIEAMAAGTPVIALDASGVRDIVRNNINGTLIEKENIKIFVNTFEKYRNMGKSEKKKLRKSTRSSVEKFTPEAYADQVLALYRELKKRNPRRAGKEGSWLRMMEKQQQKWSSYGTAAKESLWTGVGAE